MTIPVLIDRRLKSKIESFEDCSRDGSECYSVRFKDLDDTFWFGNMNDLQEFLNTQASERFYDKELRKGYFDYINEHGDRLRYYVEVKRGTFTLLRDECVTE